MKILSINNYTSQHTSSNTFLSSHSFVQYYLYTKGQDAQQYANQNYSKNKETNKQKASAKLCEKQK
jgi:hypothetical protein